MRVVQLLLSPRIGGAETLVSCLGVEFSRAGVACKTLYLDNDTSRPGSRFKRLRGLRSALREEQPDVIISHSAIPNIYARVAAPPGVPVITVLHSASDDFRGISLRLIERLLLSRTAHVVAVSESQAHTYRSHFRVKANLTTIPNGIRADLPSKRSYADTPTKIVSIARIAKQKNPWLWSEMAKELSVDSPELLMTWWGPKSEKNNVEPLLQRHAREEVPGEFAGATDDPGARLVEADIFLHTADNEAHSIGILEAAAVGLPIVCSRSVSETLPDGVVRTVFETGDADSALNAMRALINDWPVTARAAIENALIVREVHDMAACAAKYRSVIAHVTNAS